MHQDTVETIIYLVGCAVGGITPDRERLAQVNINEIYSISIGQSLQALVFVALEKVFSDVFPDDDMFLHWRFRYEAATARNRMLEEEMTQVLSFLETNGIWHIPLKGSILQDYYPQPEMRQMTDRDILYDINAQKKVHQWFISRGYRADIYNIGGVVDVYSKKPFYSFEMHTLLVVYNPGTTWQDYYDNVKERLIPDEGKMYAYHFSDEDFYIYLIIHGCKHYFNCGNGLRLLIDIYLYLKAKDDTLDWQYIHRELATLVVTDFEEKARSLCHKLFSVPEEFSIANLSQEETSLLFTFLENNTYGNVYNLVRNKIKNPSLVGKVKYAWHRLFPEAVLFKYNYPFFYRHKWLLPVGYVYRIVHRLRGNYLIKEATAIWRL